MTKKGKIVIAVLTLIPFIVGIALVVLEAYCIYNVKTYETYLMRPLIRLSISWSVSLLILSIGLILNKKKKIKTPSYY